MRSYAVACLLGLFSAEAGRMIKQMRHGGSGVGSTSKALWNTYVKSVNDKAAVAGGFQEACKPSMHEARSSYRGAIMLHHGFTACPQQYELLVPMLQSLGFTVFLPTMPGFGYRPGKAASPSRHGAIEDYIDDLPIEHEEYELFAERMHDIMMTARGEKVVGGLSVGGGVAAYQNYLGGYDRAWLAVPMIYANGILNTLLDLSRLTPSLSSSRQGWGEGCEDERAHGRAGICQFTVNNLKSTVDLGRGHNKDASRHGPNFSPGGMQIMFVEDDPTVDTDAVINLAIKYDMDRTSPWICGFDNAVGHSFLSMHDNVDGNMYWLGEVNDMIVQYLAKGNASPQSGTSQSDYPRCDVKCTPETCQYGLKYQ